MPWKSIARRAGASTRVGRYTQAAHVRAAFLEGLVQGVISLNEIVAKKTLAASDAVITSLVMAQPISLFFSAYWSNFLVGRDKRSTFLVFGVLGRLSLGLVAAVHGGVAFAAVVVFATFMVGAIIPAQNALYQSNYHVLERGRVFGIATAVQAAATIGAAVVAGRLYDFRPDGFRSAYAAAALCGFGSCWAFYRIRFRSRGDGTGEPLVGRRLVGEIRRTIRSPFAGSLAILRRDRGFRRYEAAFMAYGMAYMMLQPVLPIFLVERLHVDYAQASNARGLIFYGMMALFSPVFGRFVDRTGAVRLSMAGFLVLAAFPAILMSASKIGTVYLAFVVYGIAMAAVNIGWTLGPIHFAGASDSAAYMGAHVALVGVRGLVGGPVGILLYRWSGTPNATFACAALLFLTGSALLRGSASRTGS
jgi:MFS family permease